MASSSARLIDLPSGGRVARRPQHPFYIHQRPFEITPFFIAPVLPGESLTRLQLQSRAVSDVLNNPLSGWWLEYYFFYVKLRDLEVVIDATDFTDMHLEPAFDLSARKQTSAHDYWRWTAIGGVKWVDYCLTRVVDEWFRDEGDVASSHVITAGRPASKINGESWANSYIPASQLAAADVEVADLDPGTAGGDDKLMASEIDAAMRQYEFLRENGLVEMDYEDYLATFGIKVPGVELHRPELVRYIREWTYPTNTIDPDTGAPRSAVSWAVREQASKRRFFKEPGFLFGVTVARPKVFYNLQKGAMSGFLDNALMWLPAMMSQDPRTSLRKFDDTTGVIAGSSVDYVVDMRDLFVHGEQFVNVDPTTAGINTVALPKTDATDDRYPAEADVDAMFVTVEDGTAGLTKYRVRQDGVVAVSIMGNQVDTSPRGGSIVI